MPGTTTPSVQATPTAPPPAARRRSMHRLADGLFTRDAKARIRLLQTAVALLIAVSGVVAMQYVVWAGLAPRRPAAWWSAIAVGGYLGFLLAIRCGWSRRMADPSMTIAQMVFAVGCCATAYALAGVARGAVFPLVMLMLMFSMFNLTPRQVRRIGLFAVGCFGATMAWMSQRRPDLYPPVVERAHFLIIATTMPAVSVLAWQLGRLRARLQHQKAELKQALARISEMAERDELTGLLNRRSMLALIEQERERSLRDGSAFCIGMVDLDHFKRINDQHGHGVGDEVLRAFARQGRAGLRVNDALARWGGEEFMLLMRATDARSAHEAVDRLRRDTAAIEVPAGGTAVRPTMSAGAAQFGAGESVTRLIERADAALYAAKAAGRNRVVVVADEVQNA